MKPRTSPIVLGFIWGILAMMLSFAVFCVFASLKLVFNGFPLFAYDEQSQYLLIGAVFLLGVLGAIGAGIMPRLMRLGGVFLLLSCIGVTGLLFAPVIMQSFSFEPLAAYGIYISPLALLIANFSMGVLTAIGLLGGILAFIPKKDRKAQAAQIPGTQAAAAAQPKPAPAVPAAAPEAAQAAPPAMSAAAQPESAPAATAPEITPAAPAAAQAATEPDMVSAAQPNAGLTNLE
ncbi:MAG: hypothetical protein ACOX8N_01155 [Christensenellales bacterium]|jgi:hypothetical protein